MYLNMFSFLSRYADQQGENFLTESFVSVLHGKSVIDWIMGRYQINIYPDRGIQNDPNDWSKEAGNA